MSVHTIILSRRTTRDGLRFAWFAGVFISLLSLLLLSPQLHAGEPPTKPEMSELEALLNEDGGTKGKKTLKELPLHELLRFQSYVFIASERDPFVFRVPEAKKDKTVKRATNNTGTPETTPEGTQSKEQIRIRLLEDLRYIEIFLFQHEYGAAIEWGKKSSEYVGKVGGNLGGDENDRIWRQIKQYISTAKRLKKAKETKDEFEKLPMTVTGIRWTPRGASAIIQTNNPVIYEAGGIVRGLQENDNVQVEYIEERAVIFVYKGFKFRKAVTVIPGSDTPQ